LMALGKVVAWAIFSHSLVKLAALKAVLFF